MSGRDAGPHASGRGGRGGRVRNILWPTRKRWVYSEAIESRTACVRGNLASTLVNARGSPCMHDR